MASGGGLTPLELPGVEAQGGEWQGPELKWSVSPWRRHPGKAALVALFILGVAAGAWWFSGHQIFFGLLALVMLWSSVGSFYTTTRYQVDDGGVAIDSPFLRRRRAWSEVRSWYLDERGATLSPFAGSSWLESYRSIRLLLDGAPTQLKGILHERLGPPKVGPPGVAGKGQAEG